MAWVDAEDYAALAAFNWTTCGAAGAPHYAVRRVFPDGRRGRDVAVRMHSAIMPGLGLIDHRDHHERIKVVDNRRRNLRPATTAENTRNSRKIKRGSSPYKGVSRTGRKGTLWQARIRVDGKNKELGCYRSPERAALAYDEAAIRHFGDFAWTNFPREMQA